jgi:hypothetical protein
MKGWSLETLRGVRWLGLFGLAIAAIVVVDLADDGMIGCEGKQAPGRSSVVLVGGVVAAKGCGESSWAESPVGQARLMPGIGPTCPLRAENAACQRAVAGAWGCPDALRWVRVAWAEYGVVDTDDRTAAPGDIVVVEFPGGRVGGCHVGTDDHGVVWLLPLNPSRGDPVPLTSEAVILGRVRAWVSEEA